MDLPKGCWTVATEDMAQAGTASHAGRGIFYLRGEGKDLFNLYMPKYAGVDEKSGLPLYWHRVTYYDVNMNETTVSTSTEDVTPTIRWVTMSRQTWRQTHLTTR